LEEVEMPMAVEAKLGLSPPGLTPPGTATPHNVITDVGQLFQDLFNPQQAAATGHTIQQDLQQIGTDIFGFFRPQPAPMPVPFFGGGGGGASFQEPSSTEIIGIANHVDAHGMAA
jgi:hypothetical protein